MHVSDAQREVRTTFRGGLAGQLVSAAIWFAAAAAGTWGSHALAVIILFFGGFFIFPLTLLTLRLAGRPTTASAANPLNPLAIQVAFTVPIGMLVVLALTRCSPRFFFPGAMLIVGAHYLPFIFLYGMWEWAVLAAAMIGGGLVLGEYMPMGFAAGGWFTGAALAAFAFVGWRSVVAEERKASA